MNAELLYELSILGEVLLAGLFGGLIGYERELADKPAGLRTHILVAMSAALIVALGEFIPNQVDNPDIIATDPVRIIQAIVVGISFLGAGTILQREKEGRVEGLTTAASILATAAIGITVAMKHFFLATSVTITILIVVWFLSYIERRLINN